MFLSFLASCTSVIDEMTSEGDGEIQKVTICLSDSDISVNSRMNIAVSGSVKYYWENTDTIGIFPDDGYQVAFPLKTSGESSSATFTGGGWALKSSSTYAAYYPFEYNYRRSDSIPVSYLGQKQIGNKSSALADKYNYMSAVGNKPAEGSLNFDMKRLGRFIILKFNLAEPTTLTSVKLIASESVFTTKGYFNLWANTHSIIPLEKSNSLTIDLEDIETTIANEEVTIYFCMPPVNLSGENLTLEVTDENTNKLQYSVPGKDMTESKAYALNATIKESPFGNGTYQNGVVSIAEAGTMKKLLGDDYLNITSLKVVGPINGDDVYYLRKMLGGNNFSEADWGKLTTLDLSEATIIEGGEWYIQNGSEKNYTSNNIIGEHMFFCCNNLQNIIFPNSATEIAYNACAECPNLSSITIGNGISSIGKMAFSKCYALTSVIIPDNVISIGFGAFWYCSSLKSANIGNSVISIGEVAFSDCSSLTSIIIPSSVTSIGEAAFYGCSSLLSTTIGNNVTSIGEGAFQECSSLTSINIPDGVTSIGCATFYKCISLTSVSIPNGITLIDDKAFMYCASLTSISIPENVTSIGDEVFYGCSSLASITISKSVSSIGQEAFSYCSKLISITIPNGKIKYRAFANCSDLTFLNIGDGVVSIANQAFSGCSSLKTITIGTGLTSITDYVFKDCSAIAECYCYASTPPTFYNAFGKIEENAILYVPARCGSIYQTSYWSNFFKNIKEMD